MAYIDVDVVIAGALNEQTTLYDGETRPLDEQLDLVLSEIEDEAKIHGEPTEVYVQRHDHEPADCECAQFETDHHPMATYNIST